MTKAHSEAGDNGGRCERCNEPASEFRSQVTVPVRLGGGLGWGTMWVCSKCERDDDKVPVHQRGKQMETRHHWTVEDVCDARGEVLAQRTQRESADVTAIIRELSWSRPWREREAADVGCGYGRLLPALMCLRQFGRVTGFEREKDLLLAADSLVSASKYARLFHVASLADLRYEDEPGKDERVSDGYFDFVLTFTVLQHLPQQEALATIYELRRISRQYILLCEETDETLRGLNTAGGYSTWGRPFEWYQMEMARSSSRCVGRDPHRHKEVPPFRLDHTRPRRVEDGYPRTRCGTFMLFASER